jgi:peptidoglycan/LPS O-acetylase OafA/YrhL
VLNLTVRQPVGDASAKPTVAAVAYEYRPDIDGLRAVAVLLVLAYHGFPKLVPGGYVGVDVFFVISGYLITGIVLAPLQEGKFSFKDFYRRRIRRLYPALLIVLPACGIIGWFLLSPPAFAQLGKHIASSAAFVPNLTFWGEAGYFDRAAELKPLRHLWSLGVEEQFYLVWPLTLYSLTRFRRSVTLALLGTGIVSFVACVTIVRTDSIAAFYSPFTRAWELLLGGLLMAATLERKGSQVRRVFEEHSSVTSSVGLGLIVCSAVILTDTSTFPGWWALPPTLGAALLIASGPLSVVNRMLSLRGLVAIGLISYPLYLWHWPLLSFAAIDANGTPAVTTRIVALVVAFGLAAVTFAVIEKPIRRRRRSWRDTQVLVGLMVLVGGIGFIADARKGFPERFPVSLQTVLNYASYEFAKDARANICWLQNTAAFSSYGRACYLESQTAHRDGVLVWGDSHAARLYPGIRKALGVNANIGQFTRDNCPPVLDYTYSICEESNQRILQEIRVQKPRTVILFAVWSAYSDWAAGSQSALQLGRTLDDVRRAGVTKIVLVGSDPKWKVDLPTMLYEDWKRQTPPRRIPGRLATGLMPVVRKADAGLKEIAQTHHVTFVSLLDLLCNDQGCLTYLPERPGKLFSWDYGHLTTEGATFVANALIESGALPTG